MNRYSLIRHNDNEIKKRDQIIEGFENLGFLGRITMGIGEHSGIGFYHKRHAQ
jgi:hypothetical protein